MTDNRGGTHDCMPDCPPSHRAHLSHLTDGHWHDNCRFCLRRRVKGGTGLEGETITALCTLQFGRGGLFDWEPVDGYGVHLVRRNADKGTPGPTLCGIDRFAKDAPGWSVGGGISGPGIVHKPCPGCAAAAREQFLGLPVAGTVGAAEMAAELGVEVSRG